MLRLCALLSVLAATAFGEIHEHPGGKILDHSKYIRVVSETDSPVERVFIKSKDGVYVAASIRRPKIDGKLPAVIYFHGAPGGRGMEQLVSWSLGATGGPVWERLLQEGFVVVVADYRHPGPSMAPPTELNGAASFIDDGLAIINHVRSLPYVDPKQISLYGVSLGGNLVAYLAGKADVRSAILGAPAVVSFLGMQRPSGNDLNRYKDIPVDEEVAKKNIEALRAPLLILVGTADALIHVDRKLHERMVAAGKPVRMEIYENGYHDFCMGPQGHTGRAEPLMDSTLDALEQTVAWLKNPSVKVSQ